MKNSFQVWRHPIKYLCRRKNQAFGIIPLFKQSPLWITINLWHSSAWLPATDQIRSGLAADSPFNQVSGSQSRCEDGGGNQSSLLAFGQSSLVCSITRLSNFALFVTWIFNRCHKYWKILKGKTPVSHF